MRGSHHFTLNAIKTRPDLPLQLSVDILLTTSGGFLHAGIKARRRLSLLEAVGVGVLDETCADSLRVNVVAMPGDIRFSPTQETTCMYVGTGGNA